MVMSMYKEALNILKKIEKLGFEAYIIGGYPRDKYMNIESDDIDICTNIPEKLLEENFNVTKKNGYASFIIDDLFEITLYREDIYNKARYPLINLVNTLEQDLMRRDFIINTLCIDSNGEYVDKLGARKEIDNKIINTIKDPDISFNEDPIRIVRAIRFKIDLEFRLSKEIEESIEKNKNLIEKISKNRIQKEIDKIKKLNKEEIYKYVGEKYAGKSN